MDSSSRETLHQIFTGIIEWRRGQDLSYTIPWTDSHLSAIHRYVLKLGIHSNSRLLTYAENLLLDEVWCHRFEPGNFTKFAEMVSSFTGELQVLFAVPKLHDNTLKKNEIVAAFINFLLELLYHQTDLIRWFEDRIVFLNKELRFLITVLGDKVLLSGEMEHVANVLAGFEAVANEAGSLVYSFLFAADGVFVPSRMNKALVDLSVHIKLLKADITGVLFMPPYMSKPNIIQSTVSVDSLFIVDSLIHDLGDLMNLEDNRIVDVKGQIKMLHQGLMLSQSLLKDIKQMPRHLELFQELKEPMVRIIDVAYEAEYLVNSFLVRDAPLWYLTIRLTDVIHKLKLVGTELQEIKKNTDTRDLIVDFSGQLSLQPKRNSDVDDVIVGFEKEAIDILDHLVGGTDQLQIISILGMPGQGKTTLAKRLYNHPSVNYYFDKCSWCVISQTYQRKNKLSDILISLGSECDKNRILTLDEGNLAEDIYKSLKGRRYLIVMDDIWNLNVWEDLRTYFPDDRNGSRIMFTSRNKDVSPSSSIIYPLSSLSSDQCWELLEKKVFRNTPCPPQLLGIGKRIAADCYGLPLAVVVIAGILSNMDKEESTWENVRRRLTSYILSDENDSTMQILKLSYKHLPEHLKPCFLYFGAFPEDTEIPVKKLKFLWIVEGFICKEESESAESIAERYLVELIDKSLVIVGKRRSDGGAKACIVHDLLRDLCLRIAEEENFLKLMNHNYSIYTNHHRLCLHMSPTPTALFSLPFGFHVRSFLATSLDSPFYVLNMKLLRVLDLPNHTLGHDHDGVGLLVHLRYLAIKIITESIGSLVNLEFLIVNPRSFQIVCISSLIQKMVRLRYLSVHQASFCVYSNISQTNKLEFLSDVDIYRPEDEGMLKCFPHLRKLKCHCALFVDEQGDPYCFPDLRFLTELESLRMTGNFPLRLRLSRSSLRQTIDFRRMARVEINLPINLPYNIKKLTLSSLHLPWEKMSIIGELPNLQVLKLGSGAFVGEIWDTRDGEFQQLKFLKLGNIHIAQWNVDSSEHFPKLQRLVLHDCRYLQEIPREIGDIATLQLIEVVGCSEAAAQSAKEIQRGQLDNGNEELKLITEGICTQKGPYVRDVPIPYQL